jgi:hypothetical protein
MFIDDIQAMQERGEQLRKLRTEATDEEFANLQRQLALLDAKCPRYDVHNVFSALNPTLIASDSPLAAKRNAEMVERRNDLVNLAGKAPMGPPWFAFSLEHRYSEWQRVAYLVRAVDENGEPVTDLKFWHRRFVATTIFDSLNGSGQVEYNPNAFEILLDEDDQFASFQYDSRLSDGNLDATKQGAELVRTCIQLLNWDREDVPTQTLVNPKQQKNTGKKGGKPRTKKSDPTIIKFEPFLKKMKQCNNDNGGNHSSPGWHLRKGGYANYKYNAPMFGLPPVLGRTYGRITRKPTEVNQGKGKMKTTKGVVKVGNVRNPADSQPMIPFPASPQDGGTAA